VAGARQSTTPQRSFPLSRAGLRWCTRENRRWWTFPWPGDPSPFPANMRSFEPGTKRNLVNGTTPEVATDPRDGVWDLAQVTEGMVSMQDVRQPTREELRQAFQVGFQSIDDGDLFDTGFYASLASMGYRAREDIPCTCPDGGQHGHLPECRWVKP
jgi:hypothetical protein